MTHEIFIKDAITPESGIAITGQMAGMELAEGDILNIYFDSEGGYIEPAFLIARCIEGIQSSGVICHGIALGKVWSSAIIPYLSCAVREMSADGEFLIHKVSINVDGLGQVDSEEVANLNGSLWDITYAIDKHYQDRKVSPEAISHLYRGDDLIVNNVLEAIGYGLVTNSDIVKLALNMRINNLKKIFSKKPLAVYRLTCNFKQFKDEMQMNTDLDKKIETVRNEMEKKFDEKLDAVLNAIKDLGKLRNSDEIKVEEETKNEAEALTDKELASMREHMKKTPVTVEGNDDVKWLAHPSKDLEKDHFVIPITKDGKAIFLPEGDYKVNDGDDEFLLHSTGTTSYIHGRGIEGKGRNEGEEISEEKPEPKNEKEVKEEKVTRAPLNKGTTGVKNNKVKEYYLQALRFGRGGVGFVENK